MATAGVLGATLGLPACSVPTSDLPRPGTCDPFQLTAVIPAPDSTGVAPDVVAALTFNDFPDPDTVNSSTFLLYTGFYYHTGRYWVDLVTRRSFFRPSSRLGPGLGYTLVIRSGIRSLRGCRLDPGGPVTPIPVGDTIAFRFEIVDPNAERYPTPVAPPTADFAQVVRIFSTHCAGAACHVPSADDPASGGGCATAPGGGLSLCESEARASLLGAPSREVRQLVLVAPHDASRSYLLRKIIGAPPVVGHIGVPGDSLSADDLRTIQDWIDNGALGDQPGNGGL